MWSLRWDGSAHLRNVTGCLKPCQRTEYIATPFLESTNVPDPGKTVITLHKQEGEMDLYREEVLEYTLWDLVADIGGMMGLFLGLSIWGMANTIRHMFKEITEGINLKCPV